MTGQILILRAAGLGAFLTAVPAYRAVRRAFPGHQIVLAAPGAIADLAPLTGAIDQLLPTTGVAPIPWAGRPPELAIDMHGRGPASRRLLTAIGPGRLIAFGSRQGGGFAGPPWRQREHDVIRWCRLCLDAGIAADPADLLLAGQESPAGPPAGGPHQESRHRGAPLTLAASPPAVVRPALVHPVLIHPGASAASRRWPVRRFATVARKLADRGHTVQITGSAPERGLALEIARLAELPYGSVLAGRTDLATLAWLTASAQLVISGDTGMAHLAVACARPSVTLLGPVPPAECGPPGHPRHQVLWHGTPGRRGLPGYRGDPHAGVTDPALAMIGAGEVLDAADRALAAAPQAMTPAAGHGPGACPQENELGQYPQEDGLGTYLQESRRRTG